MPFKRIERPPTQEPITPDSNSMLRDNPRLAQWLDLLTDMVNDLAPSVGQDIGNADATLIVGRSAKTQIFLSPISALRTVTLSTAYSWNGAKFRIVRAATATGAFSINIGNGPLKALSVPGSFCDVEMIETGWILTAYGML